MLDTVKDFLAEGTILTLESMRRSNDPAYYAELSRWYTILGSGTGLSISKLEEIIKTLGPVMRDDRTDRTTIEQTWAEVMALDENKRFWVVDGLLYGQGLSIMSADPKAGKSTLARWLAACVLAGHDFLGRRVPRGKVLYYSLEDPAHVIADDIKAYSRHLGLSWDDGKDSLFVFRKTANMDIIEDMVNKVEERKINLVIIDTLFRFLGAQGESEYGQITQEMERIRGPLSRWHDVHILALHHNRKAHMGNQQGDAYRAQLGSAALRGSTDINMCLSVTKDGQRLFHRTEGRVRDQLGPYYIARQPDGRMEWTPAPSSDSEERDTARVESLIEYLQDNPGAKRNEAQQYLRDHKLGLGNTRWAGFWTGLEADGVIRVEKNKLYFAGANDA